MLPLPTPSEPTAPPGGGPAGDPPGHDPGEAVVVVGGGLAGLGAAWALHAAGVPVVVVEAGGEVGGVVRSIEHPIEPLREAPGEGITGKGGAEGRSRTLHLELGPQTLATRDPGLLATFDALGLTLKPVRPGGAGARRYVVHRGRPEPLPRGPLSLASTPLLSMGARLHLLGEPFRRAPARGEGDPEESVASFVRRRLGPEVLERFVDPFVSGVHAGDPERLSLRAVLPEVARMEEEEGGLVRGLLARRKRAGGGRRATPGLFSFEGGLQAWPRAVASRVPVHLHRRVRRLSPREDGGWRLSLEDSGGRVAELEARAVVLATPAAVTGALVEGLGSRAAEALAAIPYAPVSLVHMAWPRQAVAHPLDGFGILAPSVEGRSILGSLWPSSLFPDRAPPGWVVTATFVGGARAPERAHLPDAALLRLVAGELEELLGAKGPASLARVTRWPRAIPQYTAGHLGRVERIRAFEASRTGLSLAGNWEEGVSLAAAWKSGERAASRLLRAQDATPRAR